MANAKLPGGAKNFTVATAISPSTAPACSPSWTASASTPAPASANNPAFWQSDYFQTSGKGYVVLNPGDLLKQVHVQMGVLNVNVKNSSGTPANMSGALVVVRSRDTGTGCNQDLKLAQGNTNASGNVSFVLPFGTYRICTSGVPVPSTTRFRETSGTTGSNQDPRVRPPSNMTFQSNLQIPNSGSSGSCSTATDTSP